jgi:hypothetical protein
VNNNRHAVIYTKKGLTYWLLYKREVFKSFGVIFDKQGVGDSINAEFLGMALNQKIDGFIFCYKQGIIYKISPREVFDYHLVRETDKTEERTYSFPIMVETPWR